MELGVFVFILYVLGALVWVYLCARMSDDPYDETGSLALFALIWPLVIGILLVLAPFALAYWLGRAHRGRK